MLAEPDKAHEDGKGVDEAEVGEHGDKVQVELLVRVEVLDVHA